MATAPAPDAIARTQAGVDKATPREYIVFAPVTYNAEEESYFIVGRYKAITPEDALDQAAEDIDGTAEQLPTLVPVAARDWQPRTPKVEEPPPPKVLWT